jgi:hypothetical protein
MTTHNFAVDHSDWRLLIALPEPYDAAREHYETLIPAADYAGFYQMTSWQAVLELAKSQAPPGWPRPRWHLVSSVMTCAPERRPGGHTAPASRRGLSGAARTHHRNSAGGRSGLPRTSPEAVAAAPSRPHRQSGSRRCTNVSGAHLLAWALARCRTSGTCSGYTSRHLHFGFVIRQKSVMACANGVLGEKWQDFQTCRNCEIADRGRRCMFVLR